MTTETKIREYIAKNLLFSDNGFPYADDASFLEEGIVDGGAGSAVRELLDREGRFDIRFLSLGVPIGTLPLGKSEEIRAALGLDVPGLVRRIREFYQPPTA